ncbi:MAG: UDP-3-O-[3-hydroxymyristoyl] N-acetylglucosamine deacetylase [Candidatus Omnitrophica bacterium]|nr:UDP-3-O-[3-hydroxymyristoyl] N-acetylglucosamine deacetylase [Candidatus Omnitrophota bacterium]
MKQCTLRKDLLFEGIGIHSGKPVRVHLKSAEAGSGIRFRRTDIASDEAVPARSNFIGESALRGRQTTLGEYENQITTIEHLMAAFHGLGVDNALVEVHGNELPALDGSAKEYVEAILRVGLKEQDAERRYLTPAQPVYVQDGDGFVAAVLPSDEFRVSYTLSYDGTDIEDQWISFRVTPDIFAKEIAPARTFCLKQEADALLKQGYGQGANFDNTLVFEKGRPIQTALRFVDEPARHKALDIIGDLYLTGFPLRGHVVAVKTGHAQNLELVKKLISFCPVNESLPNEKEKSMGKNLPRELDATEIQKIIPHRHPFLWVDRIIKLAPGKSAVGIKNVTLKDYFFEGHFPGHPVMPGVIILEAMAQVGAVAMLCQPEYRGRIAYLMSIDSAKFRKPVFPGSELRMEIEILKTKSRIGQCRGVAKVNGEVVCEAEVKFAFVRDAEENGSSSNK